MRHLVTKKSFVYRRRLDTILHKFIPNTWIPLYSTVHFSRMSFQECIANKKWQDKVRLHTHAQARYIYIYSIYYIIQIYYTTCIRYYICMCIYILCTINSD